MIQTRTNPTRGAKVLEWSREAVVPPLFFIFINFFYTSILLLYAAISLGTSMRGHGTPMLLEPLIRW